MANDDFSEPPRPADSKIPFSFFPDFWVWVTSKAWGSDSVGFWGSCQLSPFWGRGGPGRRALLTPPLPGNENPGLPFRNFSQLFHNCSALGLTLLDRPPPPPPCCNRFEGLLGFWMLGMRNHFTFFVLLFPTKDSVRSWVAGVQLPDGGWSLTNDD